MNLTHGGDTLAAIDDERVEIAGHPAIGGHRLDLKFIVKTIPTESRPCRWQILFRSGTIGAGGRDGVVATLHADQRTEMRTINPASEYKLLVFALLDSRQIERVDELRHANTKGELQLKAKLLFDALPFGEPLLKHGEYPKQLEGVLNLRFPREQWLDAISASEFGSYILSEVILPRTHVDPRLATALEAFESAEEQLRAAGKQDLAIDRLRVVLDTLGVGGIPSHLMSWERKGNPTRTIPDELTIEERLTILDFAIRNVTHPAHHQFRPGYSREHAKLLAKITAAVLEFRANQR